MKKQQHRHRVVSDHEFGFSYCVAPRRCNPSAHGAAMTLSVCSCGWIKETNRNGGRVEAGSWHEPRPGDYVGILK